METVHDIIETLFKDTLGVSENIKNAEVKLARDKERRELEERCSRHILNKLTILKKEKLYKRQNSFVMTLDTIKDIRDVENCELQYAKLRLSPTHDRNFANYRLQDCTKNHLAKDPNLVSEESFSEDYLDDAQVKAQITRKKRTRQKSLLTNELEQSESSESEVLEGADEVKALIKKKKKIVVSDSSDAGENVEVERRGSRLRDNSSLL